jgi:adenylate kinase
VCDLDGSELAQRADDAEATVRARMAQQVPPLLEVVEHYRAQGILTTVDGRLGIAPVTEALLTALADVGAA